MTISVVHAAERDSLIVNLRLEREHLESAGIGEGETIPPAEGTETPQSRDRLSAGSKHQVVRVAENDPGAQSRVVVRTQILDRPSRPDGHEQRGPVLSTGSSSSSRPRRAIAGLDGELDGKHGRRLLSVSIEEHRIAE